MTVLTQTIVSPRLSLVGTDYKNISSNNNIKVRTSKSFKIIMHNDECTPLTVIYFSSISDSADRK